jgi:hypothetical protein
MNTHILGALPESLVQQLEEMKRKQEAMDAERAAAIEAARREKREEEAFSRRMEERREEERAADEKREKLRRMGVKTPGASRGGTRPGTGQSPAPVESKP